MRGVLVLLLVLLTCGGSVAWALLRPRAVPPLPSLTVEVLNGSGTEGLAARAAIALRELGQDVVATGNAARTDYPSTVVVDRRGRPWLARRLAERIGPAMVVLQQQTPVPAADVTLLLGRDHAALLLFGGGPPRRGGALRWLPGGFAGRLPGGCLGRWDRQTPQRAALPPAGTKCYLAGGERPSIREVWRCPDDLWVSWP
jgi:hypothetical protein